jgi:hypothetical protein
VGWKVLFVLISSLVQVISIPFFYKIVYWLSLLFHDPFARAGRDGMDFYSLGVEFTLYFSLLMILVTSSLQEWKKNEWLTSSFHLIWILFIVVGTWSDLNHRPYTHGLLLVCIASTFIMRIVFNRFVFFPKMIAKSILKSKL